MQPMKPALVPELDVADLDESLRFYVEVCGFRVLYGRPEERFAYLEREGAELMLQQLSADQQIRLDPAVGQSWVIYLRVDDIEALHARLKRGGFPVSEIAPTSYGTRECFVSDPDGYELWISVPIASAGDSEEDDEG